jgi:hypothetical protein
MKNQAKTGDHGHAHTSAVTISKKALESQES